MSDERRLGGRGLARAFGFAYQGLHTAWSTQRNFRIEVAIGAVAGLLCWWSGAPYTPVLVMTGLVLGLELINSAVEALVDLVEPNVNPTAAAAKDLAAAAVLVAAGVALLVGVLVIGPPLVYKLSGLLGGGA